MGENFRNRKLGWRRSFPDKRDIFYVNRHPLKALRLPFKVDLRPKFPKVNDQGLIGSCTACAGTDCLEYLDLSKDRPLVNLSRLFLYYNSREFKDQDCGAYLRDVFKSMNSDGICPENMWPYEEQRYYEKPIDECYTAAKKCIAVEYLKVNQNGYEIKSILAEGFPICFGMTIYGSFYEVGSDGIVATPSADERSEGGHAMSIVGYLSDKEVYIIRNSWGDGYGDNGYCYIRYAMIDNPGYSADFWVVKQKGETPPTPRATSICGSCAKLSRKANAAWAAFKKV